MPLYSQIKFIHYAKNYLTLLANFSKFDKLAKNYLLFS